MEGKPSAGGDGLESVERQDKQKPQISQLPSAFGLAEIERRESAVIEDDVSNDAEDKAGKSENLSPWQRMQWTGKSVKLLVTILSYIGEDPSADCSSGQKKVSSLLRKQGKWRCISKVMADRGYHVSPQQCEDKFNNLNKTYRRLNELLGRGISCKVVENPELLDMIDVSEQVKEEVRKLLTSKHLFYEEMCSFRNGNRLNLPHDPDLLRSLLFILRNEDDYKLVAEVDAAKDNEVTSVLVEVPVKVSDLINENDISGSVNTSKLFDYQGDSTECSRANSESSSVNAMWWKRTNENKVADHGNPLKVSDLNQIPDCQPMDVACHEDSEAGGSLDQWIARRMHRLNKRKLKLKSKMLDLEKKRLKWKRQSRKQDLKLHKMRVENECLKLVNECIAMQLEQKRADLGRV